MNLNIEKLREYDDRWPEKMSEQIKERQTMQTEIDEALANLTSKKFWKPVLVTLFLFAVVMMCLNVRRGRSAVKTAAKTASSVSAKPIEYEEVVLTYPASKISDPVNEGDVTHIMAGDKNDSGNPVYVWVDGEEIGPYYFHYLPEYKAIGLGLPSKAWHKTLTLMCPNEELTIWFKRPKKS